MNKNIYKSKLFMYINICMNLMMIQMIINEFEINKKQEKKLHFKSEIISCVFWTLLLASEFLAFGVSETLELQFSFWILLVLLISLRRPASERFWSFWCLWDNFQVFLNFWIKSFDFSKNLRIFLNFYKNLKIWIGLSFLIIFNKMTWIFPSIDFLFWICLVFVLVFWNRIIQMQLKCIVRNQFDVLCNANTIQRWLFFIFEVLFSAFNIISSQDSHMGNDWMHEMKFPFT